MGNLIQIPAGTSGLNFLKKTKLKITFEFSAGTGQLYNSKSKIVKKNLKFSPKTKLKCYLH